MKITQEKYEEMLGALPPAFIQNATFCVGEPVSHVLDTPVYDTYAQIGEEFFFLGTMATCRAKERANFVDAINSLKGMRVALCFDEGMLTTLKMFATVETPHGLAYMQKNNFNENIDVSTVHKPNKTTGTGTWFTGSLQSKDVKGAVLNASRALSGVKLTEEERASIKKYSGINEYLKEKPAIYNHVITI